MLIIERDSALSFLKFIWGLATFFSEVKRKKHSGIVCTAEQICLEEREEQKCKREN